MPDEKVEMILSSDTPVAICKSMGLGMIGISEALITTEMGLLIAVPGYFMAYAIKRRKDEYEAFLVRLESLTLQQFKRKGIV